MATSTSNQPATSSVSGSRLPGTDNATETTSADDFTSLFGGDMMDSFGGSQMSIEELLSGAVSGPSRVSDSGGSGTLNFK